MKIGGIDPSTKRTGLAILSAEGDDRPSIDLLTTIRGSDSRDVAKKVVRAVCAITRAPIQFRIEQSPPTFRDDAGHGKQAAIGWALGFTAGCIGTSLEEYGHEWDMVDVSPWRKQMIELSTKWGVRTSKPVATLSGPSDKKAVSKVVRLRSSFRIEWSCGHTAVRTLEAIQSQPAGCPSCDRRRAEETTDAWKALACRLVAVHWPEAYRELVSDAKGRARSEKADHQLKGVSDACEAAWIACSAIPSPSPT